MTFFRTRNSMLAALGLAAVLSIPSALAQSVLRVEVPFHFQAGNQALPAGKYVVTVDSLARRIDVRLDNSTQGAYLSGGTVLNPDPSRRGALTFNQYGDRFFLRSVAVAGSSNTYQFAASSAEREMARARSPKQFALVLQ